MKEKKENEKMKKRFDHDRSLNVYHNHIHFEIDEIMNYDDDINEDMKIMITIMVNEKDHDNYCDNDNANFDDNDDNDDMIVMMTMIMVKMMTMSQARPSVRETR